MKHLIISFFFLLLIIGSHITSGQDLYIKNVNLLQVEKGYFEPNKYVLLKEGKIAAIENSEINVESHISIVDGEGKYLFPGLFDMHAHFGQPSWVPMYLHYGVTGIRVMAGNDQLLTLQDSLLKSGDPQPTLFIVSPLIDGAPPLWGDQHTEATIMHDTEIRPILERNMSKGYKELKIYNRIPEAKYLEILAFAQGYGMRVSGHLPYKLSVSNFGDKRHQ